MLAEAKVPADYLIDLGRADFPTSYKQLKAVSPGLLSNTPVSDEYRLHVARHICSFGVGMPFKYLRKPAVLKPLS